RSAHFLSTHPYAVRAGTEGPEAPAGRAADLLAAGSGAAPKAGPWPVQGCLWHVRRPDEVVDLRHGAAQPQHHPFLRERAASAFRILWHGGSRLSHLPPAALKEIRIGGQAVARRHHVIRGRWGNLHPSR